MLSVTLQLPGDKLTQWDVRQLAPGSATLQFGMANLGVCRLDILRYGRASRGVQLLTSDSPNRAQRDALATRNCLARALVVLAVCVPSIMLVSSVNSARSTSKISVAWLRPERRDRKRWWKKVSHFAMCSVSDCKA